MKSINDTTSATSFALKLSTIVPTSVRNSEHKYIPLISVKPPLSARHHPSAHDDPTKVLFYALSQQNNEHVKKGHSRAMVPLQAAKTEPRRASENRQQPTTKTATADQDVVTPKGRFSDISSVGSCVNAKDVPKADSEEKLDPLQVRRDFETKS